MLHDDRTDHWPRQHHAYVRGFLVNGANAGALTVPLVAEHRHRRETTTVKVNSVLKLIQLA